LALRDFPPLRGNYHYPVWTRALELVGITAYAVTWVMLADTVAAGFGALAAGRMTDLPAALVWTFAVLLPLVAYVGADFVSGLVHCAADNFGYETTPLFGVAFIKPFREHHRDPQGITRHDFVEANGNSCIVNLLVVLPLLALFPVASAAWALLIALFILTFTLAILGTNQFHKWAHQESPSSFVRLLQRIGLVLRPEVHKVHHTVPFDRYYCITTGWLNPVLDRIGFFEWMVRVGSKQFKRDEAYTAVEAAETLADERRGA
jgi:hypothetical protein